MRAGGSGTRLACFLAAIACVLLAGQAAFYAVAWLGAHLPGRGMAARLVRLATMFSSMNLALLVGFYRWLSGKQRGAWQRTAR